MDWPSLSRLATSTCTSGSIVPVPVMRIRTGRHGWDGMGRWIVPNTPLPCVSQDMELEDWRSATDWCSSDWYRSSAPSHSLPCDAADTAVSPLRSAQRSDFGMVNVV